MNNNSARPIPEDKRNPAPMDPEARIRQDKAALTAMSPELAAALSSLSTGAMIAAYINKNALDIQAVRAEAPHLLDGTRKVEFALQAISETIMDATIAKARKGGLPDAVINHAFMLGVQSFKHDPARALARMEAARAARAGNPAPVKPGLDLSNLI